jgi:hypothetical protein
VALCRSYSVNEIVIKVEDDGEWCELHLLTLKICCTNDSRSGRNSVFFASQTKTNRICVCYGSARASTRHCTKHHDSSTKTKECKPYCIDYIVLAAHH